LRMIAFLNFSATFFCVPFSNYFVKFYE